MKRKKIVVVLGLLLAQQVFADDVELDVLEVEGVGEKSTVKATRQEVDSEQIKRFRGSGNADVFTTMAGVQVNNIRNEANAVEIGVRGLQGEGRVPILIDGTKQQTHTFRGYQGSSDRTYIDMDLVSSIAVNKGSVVGAGTAGGIGGSVEMQTIGVNDILSADSEKDYGFLVKGTLFNNNRSPGNPLQIGDGNPNYIVKNSQKETDFRNGALTVGAAFMKDKFDGSIAYNKRRQGNYFAGKHGYEKSFETSVPDTSINATGYPPLAEMEVPNSSYEADSLVAKLGINLTDEQRLDFYYRYHKQKAGEIMAAKWTLHDEIRRDPDNPADYDPLPEGQYAMLQWGLGTARVHSYGISYSFTPSKNELVNLQANLWRTDGRFNQLNGFPNMWAKERKKGYWTKYRDIRTGIDIKNSSNFTVAGTPLSLTYGIGLERQDSSPDDKDLKTIADSWDVLPKAKSYWLLARYAKRDSYNLFLNSVWQPNKWFTVGLGTQYHGDKINDHQAKESIKYKGKLDYIAQVDFHLNNNIDLFVKYENAYRNPSLYESTVSGQVFSYDKDYPLVPEKSNNWELGAVGKFDNLFAEEDQLNFKLSYFTNKTKNYITSAGLAAKNNFDDGSPLDPELGKWYRDSNFVFINYDKFAIKGFDISAYYEHPRFFAGVSGTYFTDRQVCSAFMAGQSNGEECNELGWQYSLIGTHIPVKKRLTTDLGLYFMEKRLTVGTRIAYQSGKDYSYKLFGEGTAGKAVAAIAPSVLVNLFLNYKINDHAEIDVAVDNLTNRYAFDSGAIITKPEPGRTVRASLTYRF